MVFDHSIFSKDSGFHVEKETPHSHSIAKDIIPEGDLFSIHPEDDALKDIEDAINQRIMAGDSRFYKFIPILTNVDLDILTHKHWLELNDENWYELVKYSYHRSHSPSLLDYIVENAHKSQAAFDCLTEIAERYPDIIELPFLIEEIKKTCHLSSNLEHVEKPIYFQLTSGLIVKIDRSHFTAYRLNDKKKEWQLDRRLFTDYEYGNLIGSYIHLDDEYPLGPPFDCKKWKEEG